MYQSREDVTELGLYLIKVHKLSKRGHTQTAAAVNGQNFKYM